MGIDELSREDETLLDQIQDQVDEKAVKGGLAELGEHEKVVYVAIVAKAMIDNGGFKSLYESKVTAADAADAFERLGMESLVDACRALLDLLPGRIESKDRVRRELALNGLGRQQVEAIQRVIRDVPMVVIRRRLLEYIRARASVFGIQA